MKQSSCQFRNVVVFAAMLIALIAGTMRPGFCDEQLLTGGVQHAEKLPPVHTFQLGTQYNEAQAMASVTPSRTWYRVPPWLSGWWQTDQYTETLDVNYTTGYKDTVARVHSGALTERWGMQRDAEGGIWDTIDLPFIGSTTSTHRLTKDLHTGDALIFDSATKLMMMYRATRTTIDRQTNIITKVQQFESLATLTLAGPNLVRDEYSLKFFDQEGNPTEFVQGWRYERRYKPFQICRFDNGQDSGPDFKAYLSNQGLTNLIPQ